MRGSLPPRGADGGGAGPCRRCQVPAASLGSLSSPCRDQPARLPRRPASRWSRTRRRVGGLGPGGFGISDLQLTQTDTDRVWGPGLEQLAVPPQDSFRVVWFRVCRWPRPHGAARDRITTHASFRTPSLASSRPEMQSARRMRSATLTEPGACNLGAALRSCCGWSQAAGAPQPPEHMPSGAPQAC